MPCLLSGENESRNSANTGKLVLFFQMQASSDPVSLQSDVSLSFALFGCKNIIMSSFKSSRDIQKKEGGPDSCFG